MAGPTSANAAAPLRDGASVALAPLSGSTRVLGTIAVALATFMNVLDTSIANVSIPAMSGDLGVSPDQGTWVITSFAAANGVALPLTGWLTQRYGQVRLFTVSTLLFVLASLLCGLAPSMGMLIAFRVIQGAVAGPMIPLSQTLLLSSYPKEKAGTALGLWGVTTLVAPVVGPVLGGWITDNVSWPWIFYINVPIGIVAVAVTWMIYAKRESPRRRLPIDGVGLFLLVAWVASLQIMLDRGKDLDWFGSKLIVALAIVAALGFALFCVWELTETHPVVDLRLFAQRNFWTGTLALALAYGAYFASIVLLPLWLQQYMGYTATLAGLALAPVGILAIMLTPLVGRNAQRVDPRLVATTSLVIFAVVAAMRGRFTPQADLAAIALPTIVQGAAVACFFVPLIGIALADLKPEQIAAGTGLSNFVRITAGSFATSIVTTFWDHRASLHHAQLVEHLTGFDRNATGAFTTLHSAGLSTDQAYAFANQLVNQQAFTMGALDVFNLSAALLVLLIPVVWLAHRPKGASAAPAAGE
ncbi:MAG TPA: DHA2 family efflux MFS transporter permease subunit [Casimicrobiaceae bacterium]|nr:DHA2 family efflux MFS transporter permease subunit [Casimicrobiaceae bacterium]